MCVLLLVAGHETTRSLIGGGVLALLSHPAELAALRDRPDLVDQAVEEILRYDPPVQVVARFALRDAEVSGVTVPAGSIALMLVGAANRDEALCDEQDRFSVCPRCPGCGSTASLSGSRTRCCAASSTCGSSRAEPALSVDSHDWVLPAANKGTGDTQSSRTSPSIDQ
jgi:hypothetical protein